MKLWIFNQLLTIDCALNSLFGGSPFETRMVDDVLRQCQRYYQRLYSYIEGSSSANISYAYWFFKVSMRISPTIAGQAGSVLFNATSENVGAWSGNGTAMITAGTTASAEL